MTLEERRIRSDKGRAYYAANRAARLAYQNAYHKRRGQPGVIIRKQRLVDQTPELASHPLCKLVTAVLWDTAALYADVTGLSFDLDHIVPVCLGGANAPWNLRPLETTANLSRRKSLA